MKLIYLSTLGCVLFLLSNGCSTAEKPIVDLTDASADQSITDGAVKDTSTPEDLGSIDAADGTVIEDTQHGIDLPKVPDVKKEKEPMAGMCVKDEDCESDFCVTEFLG